MANIVTWARRIDTASRNRKRHALAKAGKDRRFSGSGHRIVFKNGRAVIEKKQ